jgi:hypothetical protein
MRPTLPEQLRGLRLILEHTVVPAVHDEYPQSTLQGVIRALLAVEEHVDDVGPFLAWDNAATRALLDDIGGVIGTMSSNDVSLEIGLGDLAALDRENERLRGLLAATIPMLAVDPAATAVYANVVTHLRERIARYPFVSTGSLPTR